MAKKKKTKAMTKPKMEKYYQLVFRGEKAIDSWEKEFCLEVGLFTWKHFLEAKQHTNNHYKVLHWNDSAAEEAFYAAKCRYFDRINGLPYAGSGLLMDPDMFIDEIKWEDDLYTRMLREEQLRIKLEKEDEEEDYRCYSELIEQVRLCQASEV